MNIEKETPITFLAKAAEAAFLVLLPLGIALKSPEAASVATRLHLISSTAQANLDCRLHDQVQSSAESFLVGMARIFTWPAPLAEPVIPERIYTYLVQLLGTEHRQASQQCAAAYLSNYSAVQSFKQQCDNVLHDLRSQPGILDVALLRPVSESAPEPMTHFQLHMATQRVPQVAVFHSSRAIEPTEWLDNLRAISGHITRLREKCASQLPPVKVAVLDTGYNPRMTFFADQQRKASIRDWKDFYGKSAVPVDEFGHGSFMTRLLMESAPLAHVYSARIAQSTESLSGAAESVAKAILWAGIEKKVDIISMAFGFSHDDAAIADAIAYVNMQRKNAVIFLAAAGNSAAYQPETFPARHPSVLAVHGTNCQGTFLATNPAVPDHVASVLGTFGGDVPVAILDDMRRHYPGRMCQPGSSVATAIAAGMAATLLTYAAVLPRAMNLEREGRVLQRVRKGQGMRHMLDKMALNTADKRRFVNPIWFWSDRSTDMARFCAMHDCMWQVHVVDD